jgi:shikimate kinase
MGTGKTVIGQLLAARLNMRFIDTDREVEAATGLHPSEIFHRYGEKRFRSEESLVVARVALFEGCVIATGGGVVLDAGNMANLRRNGVIVLLEARPESIAGRVARNDSRPLLSGRRKQQSRLLEQIENMLKQREQHYANHDFRVDTSDTSPDQVAAELLAFLQQMQAPGTGAAGNWGWQHGTT